MTAALIDARELAAGAKAGEVTILDVRWTLGGPWGKHDYARGHVPTAVFVDLDTELSSPPGPGGRHPLPDADAFGAAMRAKGVRDDRAVVVYDAGEAIPAARAWWLLRYFGHPQVAVLDGGLAAWEAAGYEVTAAEPRPAPGTFRPRPGAMPVLDAGGAARVARDGLLLDARASERFHGAAEPVDPVAGHIPGARNLPAGFPAASGHWPAAGELQRRLHAAGVRPGLEVGAYCGSGVSAAQLVLAAELAGLRAALYPGSWSEWITDPRRPVASDVG